MPEVVEVVAIVKVVAAVAPPAVAETLTMPTWPCGTRKLADRRPHLFVAKLATVTLPNEIVPGVRRAKPAPATFTDVPGTPELGEREIDAVAASTGADTEASPASRHSRATVLRPHRTRAIHVRVFFVRI